MAEEVIIKESFMVSKWWVQLVRGIITAIFGLIAICMPMFTVGALVTLFGIFVLIFGLVAIIASIAGRKENWWVLLIEGLVAIIIGIVTFVYPGITLTILFMIVAIWALITGILELVAAFKLHDVLPGDWMLVLAGILSILFGLVVFLWFNVAVLALILLLGFYTLFFGVILIVLSFRLKSLQKKA